MVGLGLALYALGCTLVYDPDTSRDVLVGAILTMAGLCIMGYGASEFSSTTTGYVFLLR